MVEPHQWRQVRVKSLAHDQSEGSHDTRGVLHASQRIFEQILGDHQNEGGSHLKTG